MVNIKVDFGNRVTILIYGNMTSISFTCDYEDFVHVNRTHYTGGSECFYMKSWDAELSIEFRADYECTISSQYHTILNVECSTKYTDGDKDNLIGIIEKWREEFKKIKKYT